MGAGPDQSGNRHGPARSRQAAAGLRLNMSGAIIALVRRIVIVTRWIVIARRWRGWQSTDDAYLQSDPTPIAAKVAGWRWRC